MDGGAWWATVHGVAKSRTRLSDFTHSLTHLFYGYKRFAGIRNLRNSTWLQTYARILELLKRESESQSVVSNSLGPCGLYSPWNSLGQNAGVGSLSLLQGIFWTQEPNQGLYSGLYSPWNSLGQNAGVDSLSLLQGIFWTIQSMEFSRPECWSG